MVSLLSTIFFILLTSVSSVLCRYPPSQRSVQVGCLNLSTTCLLDPNTNNSKESLDKFIEMAGLHGEVICRRSGNVIIQRPTYNDQIDRLYAITYCQAIKEASIRHAANVPSSS